MKHYVPSSDKEIPYFSPTDVKQWIYCPRVVYFRQVMDVKAKLGEQQEKGKEKHTESKETIRKRVGVATRERIEGFQEKKFNVKLTSDELRLNGRLDLVLRIKSDRCIPVEIKTVETRNGEPWEDHVYQLTSYALLLEYNRDSPVSYGYIYYTKEDALLRVELSLAKKRYVKQVLEDIEEMIRTEELPEKRVNEKKCSGGCGFQWICK